MKLHRLLISLCFVLFLGGFLPALAQSLGKSKHIILVLDTSLSVFQNNISTSMQEIVKEVLSRKKADDIVTIITFSTGVTKRVDRSQEDVEDLLKKTANYRPVGNWTFTAAMLQKLVQEASRKENKSYVQNIFILSDGLDDPPTRININLDRFQGKARVFYIRSLKDDTTQEELIRQVFPQVSIKTIDVLNPDNILQNLALLDDDFTLKGVSLQFPIDFKLIAGGKKESFKVRILANSRLASKKFIFKAETDSSIFKQQTTGKQKKQNFRLQNSTKTDIRLEEGDNSLEIPYFVSKPEEGKTYNILFSLALAQDPSNPLLSKNVKLNVVILTFFEKFYQLPIIYFVLLFIGLAIVVFVLYRIIRYQLFKPLIELTYWYDSSGLVETSGKTEKSKIELSSLQSGRYSISAKSDAFLVLPNLSSYDELVLIKKGKKFSTKVRIHPSSLRNLEGLGGGNIKRRRISNGTAFKLGRYTLSFRTNL